MHHQLRNINHNRIASHAVWTQTSKSCEQVTLQPVSFEAQEEKTTAETKGKVGRKDEEPGISPERGSSAAYELRDYLFL